MAKSSIKKEGIKEPSVFQAWKNRRVGVSPGLSWDDGLFQVLPCSPMHKRHELEILGDGFLLNCYLSYSRNIRLLTESAVYSQNMKDHSNNHCI